MLGVWKNRWFQFGAILFVIGVALLALPSYRNYCNTNDANDYYCATYEVVATLFSFIESYVGALTVAATIAIAWFTLSLRESTDKLGRVATIATAILGPKSQAEWTLAICS
jgi:hypothetical protein